MRCKGAILPKRSFPGWIWVPTTFLMVLSWSSTTLAATTGLEWPTLEELWRVLTLRDYNTRVVVIGTTLLGLAAGMVGVFLLLRKRALLSDALSHATLPGIALSFIVVSLLGGDGKNLAGLFTGAVVFAILGTASVMAIQRYSRLKDDAALGVVLSVYFGLGIALMGVATRMNTGNAAGLTSFIYGKTASMLLMDAVMIALVALVVICLSILFFKEFTLVCFDHAFAATQGWPVVKLDFLLMALVVMVTVIGLQSVGLILVVALLIIPPAAARFWTHQLKRMVLIAALIGAFSGLFGATLSALMVKLPAGAVIVLVAALCFVISLIFGTTRGLLKQTLDRRQLRRKTALEHLLRAMYEMQESTRPVPDTASSSKGITFDAILAKRSWSAGQLLQSIKQLQKKGWVREYPQEKFGLTDKGQTEAYQVVRNHRLWETYLITHADVAPGQVDWTADAIEHVLDAAMIRQLEKALPDLEHDEIPASPHKL